MTNKDLAALLNRAAAALEGTAEHKTLAVEEVEELIEDLTSAARELVGDYND